ncbi:MAG TPA: molybdopterin-dependent oxidoreductase [Thermoanaerobaculia bacterium]|jgi:DMSO/TMAO reductase YedYZ molybdopterin-dependent catalytic subunit
MTDEERFRRATRRSFLTMGVTAAVGAGAWAFLRSRPRLAGLPSPFRRTLDANDKLAMAYFRPTRLNPEYPPAKITRPRVNGGLGISANNDPAAWRLTIQGTGGGARVLTLDEIKAFPRRTMITEFRCIEGWSTINQWAGARLSDVVNAFPPNHPARYVAMETPDRGYYVGLDMESVLHPQTLLAYELNGAPLTWQHGAPLRLAIPVKYGVKNIKRVGVIRYTDVRPADFWAEQGYDWYLGL